MSCSIEFEMKNLQQLERLKICLQGMISALNR